jgi:pyridoxal 5'-phosphate synthase pdxT subunit
VKVGVLALQGDVREHLASLEEAGAAAIPVKRSDQFDTVDALVLPGGESTTIGKLLHRYELLDPIRRRALSGMPLYGTCAGAILMARETTGPQEAPFRLGVLDVVVRRNAYGRQLDSFEIDLAIKDVADDFRAVFIRAPSIESCGAAVEVLAEVDGRPVLVRQGNLLASTFHPEMTSDARVHKMFVEMVSEGGAA